MTIKLFKVKLIIERVDSKRGLNKALASFHNKID